MISVITTLYNYSDYIVDCITSFLKQDLIDSEMIIIDDYSTDDSFKKASQYECDRIKVISLNKNHGYSYAKNVGIKESKGEYLVMLDADDMLTENSLSVRLKQIKKKELDFVHGWAYDLKDGKLSISPLRKKWKQNPVYKHVHAQTVMLKKNIHRQIGLYDETMKSKSDREMWARIFNHKFTIGYVDKPVAIYRCHSLQMHRSSSKLLINEQLQKNALEIISKRQTDLSGLEMLK